MENASKALLMAAGVLLGIMILTLAVYLFTNFGGTSAQIGQIAEENQIAQFNSQFLTYVGNEKVTIYDVISMANLATQNNKRYEFYKTDHIPHTDKNDYYISVELQGKGQIEYGIETSDNTIKEKYDQYILEQVNSINASTALTYYKVQVEINDLTQRVYRVICTRR